MWWRNSIPCTVIYLKPVKTWLMSKNPTPLTDFFFSGTLVFGSPCSSCSSAWSNSRYISWFAALGRGPLAEPVASKIGSKQIEVGKDVKKSKIISFGCIFVDVCNQIRDYEKERHDIPGSCPVESIDSAGVEGNVWWHHNMSGGIPRVLWLD